MNSERLEIIAALPLEARDIHALYPFVMTTKNIPLITSIAVTRIKVDLEYKSIEGQTRKKTTNTFNINAVPSYRVFPDQSSFIFTLGINGIDRKDVATLSVAVSFIVTDQLGRKHHIKTSGIIKHFGVKNLLVSSNSTQY